MDVTDDTRRDEDFDRLLILLASEPKPGFKDAYAELCGREVDRLLRSADQHDREGSRDE